MPAKATPDPVRDVEPDEVLALTADVEHPAAESERDRETGQDQRRRLQERLREVVGDVAAVSVVGWKIQFRPAPLKMSRYARSGLWPVASTTSPPIRNAISAVSSGTTMPPAR